jgi:hypothetical protein
MRSPDRPEAAALRADAPAAGERRALAARLLRLPDGHPSSLRADGAEADWQPAAAGGESRPAGRAADTGDPAGQEEQDYSGDPGYAGDPDYAGDPYAADPDDPDDPGDLADPDQPDDPDDPDQPGSDPPGGPEPASRAAGRPSAGGAMGGREPYRPWFTDGGGGDPWFVAGL